MAFDVAGRVVFVTGAASGIGAGIAEVFAGEGATVVAADLSAGRLADEVARIDALGLPGSVHAAPLDVTDPGAVERALDAVAAQHGDLDAVVNSAGIFIDIDPRDIDRDAVRKVMEVNFFGTLNVCRAATPHLIASRGSIVNLATGGLDRPLPAQLAYVASKAAVVELTRTMALALGADGVRVNAVAPGYIDTPMIRRNHTRPDGTLSPEWEDQLETYRSYSPLHVVGEPSDVAWAIVYLVSDAAKFVTGQTLRPNGGFVVPR
ncbi:SDR family NAD(P)-dependent oxidoreductase [Agromyces aerolatus]|uniref:SDR family NAD(P)-dependent oxidoreductase n=1 Tax=Agromyces sp. LY-1074 TaxID=3074080 RepID=UPI00285A3914|nr:MULTISPECIES: SDR family oxidoreductase [unclassified Agromyces]MDR5701582.1 SDR family oxidoreductase [Agromyces sp. LY-1074]MDR5706112.1 SDR family oxidoreductase [Agromyces sp. LY-1358]